MLGVLAPSSLLTIWATRWCQRHRDRLGVLAFRQGMAPIVVGVLLATSWLLGRASGNPRMDAGLWLLTLLHACLRPYLQAWREQLGTAAALCLALSTFPTSAQTDTAAKAALA